MEQINLNGRNYPVIGWEWSDKFGRIVPLVDLPQMSDEDWNRIANSPENVAKIEELRKEGK